MTPGHLETEISVTTLAVVEACCPGVNAMDDFPSIRGATSGNEAIWPEDMRNWFGACVHTSEPLIVLSGSVGQLVTCEGSTTLMFAWAGFAVWPVGGVRETTHWPGVAPVVIEIAWAAPPSAKVSVPAVLVQAFPVTLYATSSEPRPVPPVRETSVLRLPVVRIAMVCG